ncbi:hypothetical protein G5C60_21760 [Streptomyces sp. HC44]|uniref:Uncharacterized protein n=1 Tax=Streptomyces scabichelini TaxID=2711217 RepID=A0A6G4V7S2_9ACTN|nr:hypothetical protein [Streptomyces scabichelini]NGO10142.1 hypothetical protein [Streptomyces scabichelini]
MTTQTALTFREKMSGPFAMGVTSPQDGARQGRLTDWRFVLHALVTVDDTRAFTTEPRHPGRLTGEVELPGVKNRIPFTDGVFRLFPDPRDDAAGGSLLMEYELTFQHRGTAYHLTGRKSAPPRPAAVAPLWLWPDTTTMAVRLRRGNGGDGETVGAGVLRLGAGDLARLLASLRTPRADGLLDSGQALGAYARLFAGGLAQTYLPYLPWDRKPLSVAAESGAA